MENNELQRWSAVAAGALLAAAGLKRGGRNGLLLSLAGGAFAVVGYMKGAPRHNVFDTPPGKTRWQPPRERLVEDAKAFSRTGMRSEDLVHEASEESFPASDAPSFTSTSSVGKHENTAFDRQRRERKER